MVDVSQIREHMEVIGADGVDVGTVDRVDGDRIKLTRKDSGEGSHKGHHHTIPLALVADIEGDSVRLSANADVAVTFGGGRRTDLPELQVRLSHARPRLAHGDPCSEAHRAAVSKADCGNNHDPAVEHVRKT